jgi:crotonobetainyl-CoA:carnitine CoA-transferase CaiB-like acyl-CoA transferase
MSAPLQGLRVLELASVLAGPAVGQFLAELGAEVLKIEAPAGDVTRSWRLLGEQPAEGRSAYFCAANWGKRSRQLDLRLPAARAELQALLPEVDILLMSYKAGDAQRFGLDPAQLLARFPRLILGEISGYGAEDPRVGYDAILQAEAGFTYLNGNNAGDFHKMPVALVDLLAAHQLKQGILLALYQREQSGKGQRVQVALLDAAISALANQATHFLVGGRVPQPMGSEHPNIVPYGSIYTTADAEQIVLAIGTDAQFERLCQLLQLPLQSDWRTNAQRVAHRAAVNTALALAICQQPTASFLQACQEANIPCGKVNQMDEVMRIAAERNLLLQGDGLQAVRTAIFTPPPTHILPPPPQPKS